MLKIVLRYLLISYFVLMSLFFYFGFLVMLASESKHIYSIITLPLYGSIFLISGINLIKNSKTAYLYSITSLVIAISVTTVHRFFFITNHTVQIVDLKNILLFGTPM